MGRGPGSRTRQRSVALAVIDVNVAIGVFAVTVDDVFAVECIFLVKRFVCSKAVSMDSRRLLFAVSKQESNRRLVSVFHWQHIAVAISAVSENEHRWLIFDLS